MLISGTLAERFGRPAHRPGRLPRLHPRLDRLRSCTFLHGADDRPGHPGGFECVHHAGAGRGCLRCDATRTPWPSPRPVRLDAGDRSGDGAVSRRPRRLGGLAVGLLGHRRGLRAAGGASPRDAKTAPVGSTADRWKVLANRKLAVACIVAALAFLTTMGVTILAALYADDAFRPRPTARGLVVAVFGLAGLASGRWLGSLMDRFNMLAVGAAMQVVLASGQPDRRRAYPRTDDHLHRRRRCGRNRHPYRRANPCCHFGTHQSVGCCLGDAGLPVRRRGHRAAAVGADLPTSHRAALVLAGIHGGAGRDGVAGRAAT